MTTAVTISDLAVGSVVDASSSASAAWLVPVSAVVLGIVAAAVVVAFLREQHHRRRRAELQNKLTDLEGILVGLSAVSPNPHVGTSSEPNGGSSMTSDDFVPRGPLSTAISTLRNDLGPGLPGPDRVDLRATMFVYEKLDQPITPTELAEDLSLSLRSLQRGLSASLGCTPRELILAVKMREGKRLLLDDDCRVQEAARAVGFDDPFHFSRRFKAYYRMSPSEMQARRSRNAA